MWLLIAFFCPCRLYQRNVELLKSVLLKDFGIYTASLKNEFKIGKVVDALGAEAVEKGALALVRAAFAVTAGGSLVANRG